MSAPGAVFGRCPVCAADLGTPPSAGAGWRPPSVQLDVCLAGDNEVSGWWVRTFPDAAGGVAQRVSDGFDPDQVRRRYHLCGEGHLFLVGSGRDGGPDTRTQFRNVVAAIGSVASGKSYLISRTIAQTPVLTARRRRGADTALRYRVPSVTDDIEDRPGRALRTAYNRTRDFSQPMSPTNLDDLMPVRLLTAIDRGLAVHVAEVHADVAGVADPAERPGAAGWGMQIRQPVVLRTELSARDGSPAEHGWTGIADLAGESMHRRRVGDEDQEQLLASLGGLIWVVDPAVDKRLTDLVEAALREHSRGGGTDSRAVIAASNRSDTADVRQVQSVHQGLQAEIALSLAGNDGPLGTDGARRVLMVAVNKADLVRIALTTGAGGFDEIDGGSGAVREGMTQYLHYVLDRTGPDAHRHGVPLHPGPGLRELLDGLRASDEDTVDLLVDRLVSALHRHYGNADRFWGLVHDGAAAAIELPGGSDSRVPPSVPLRVPSLQDHLADALQRGAGSQLQLRDVVAGAIGCGLLTALEHTAAVGVLLDEPGCEVRIFLCSPLGEVPTQLDGGGADHRPAVMPLDSAAVFPVLNRESAGLTQLLLSIVSGVRS
ncbi:hypothetical protein WHI96_11470 [Pseudonocardia tropica]|uniref:Uncharacterized protein n=1 Tax=Pseudonocardia tropica TaxID=681289 RepID=A0ABV1JV52_9PSEU